MVTLRDDKPKPNTVRVIRPNGDEHLLPLVIPPAPEGQEPTPVQSSRIGAFPEKVVTGDYTRFNHPWLSAFVQADWSGGVGIKDSQEATDISRYWTGTLETRFPKALTLPPYVGTVELTGNTDGCVIVGDIKHNGTTRCLVAYGTELRALSDALALQLSLTLDDAPVTSGVAFRGSAGANKRLFIPCGDNGYDIFDPASDTLAGHSTTVRPLNFVEWNRVLWCIEADGDVWYNATGNDADWTLKLTVDGDGEARALVRYVDQIGSPCLFAITDRDVQALEVSAGEAYVTSLEYAPHPDAARAATRWREWLGVSYGVDMARYDGATVSYPGLAKDHGLPAELRGAIRAMAPGWNDLFVLIEGAQVDAASVGFLETDADGDLLVARSSAKSAVYRLDSLGGWHPVWESTTTTKSATNAYVSALHGLYYLFWGYGDRLYYTKLSQEFANPAENPDAVFASSGTIISPWLDMNNTGLDMILAAIDVRHKRTDAQGTVRVFYQLDDEDLTNTWTLAAELAGPAERRGQTRIKIGDATALGGKTLYTGKVFGRIRYRLDFAVDDGSAESTTTSPLVESVALVYMLKMPTYLSWNFVVDCTMGPFGDLGNRQRQQLLHALIEDAFCFFNYQGDEWHQVKFVGAGGADTLVKFAGDREVTAIAVFAEDEEAA